MGWLAGWGLGGAGWDRVGGVGWLAGWGGPGGVLAGRVAGGGGKGRSYSQKGCLCGGVKNALRNRVG